MTQPKIEGVGHGIPRMLYASDGSNWYAILVDSDGHVKIDVVTSALPTDAATQTTLASVLTSLQLIDDLRAALGSVNTDDLQVDVKTYPGSNALGNFPFGYYDRYLEEKSEPNAVAGENNLLGTVVPAGEVWVVTNIMGLNSITNPTTVRLGINISATYYSFREAISPGANVRVFYAGSLVLMAGDRAYANFTGCTLNDDLYAFFHGYKMKVA